MANQTAAWPPGASAAANSVGAPSHREYARVALASAIGTTVEYYDFTLYATATALVFNKIFFPSGDPLVGSLAAFATFFVGYCARPLGGILFGHFGDRLGRRNMLILTVLIMGLGTFLIGLMPTYAQVGLWRRSSCSCSARCRASASAASTAAAWSWPSSTRRSGSAGSAARWCISGCRPGSSSRSR